MSATDGLRLHVRVHGPDRPDCLPVVCLAGLARHSEDFEPLATTLTHDPGRPRRVFALDARGRGKSEHDKDPAKYNLAVEADDVLAVLTAMGIHRAVIVGTSRGGLLAMLLASQRPRAVAGIVLNDIGPVIETKGLLRIKGYVGKLPQPRDLADGAQILRRLFDTQFPAQSDDDWLVAARRTWEARDGKLVLTYDERLSKTLDSVDADQPAPALWSVFDGLADIPLMVIRGANSDLLSQETVRAMRERRHGRLTFLEVPDQGHAPVLAEPETLAAIAQFVAECDVAEA